ncbi:MAG: hypothetical protein CMI26_12725 [Opitutae bacterium]|nr:hypothetical protein [Opitutae bacterium]
MNFLRIPLLACASTFFAFDANIVAQDLPGAPLPGKPTTTVPAGTSDGILPATGTDAPPPPGGKTKDQSAEIDPATAKEVKDVISSNLYACSKRNLTMAMGTIHPESPTLESSRDMMRYIFARLRLKYTLEKTEVIDVRGDEARIKVTQATQKISGNAAFRDNRVTIIHTLKRDGKKWKMFSSEAQSIQFFEY